jgi:hypothetical protein
MPSSLRLAHPDSTTPIPSHSTTLVPSTVSPNPVNVAETPAIAATRNLRVLARVHMPGMHNGMYATDAHKSHFHLTTTKSIDLEPVDKLEFDGIVI